MDIDGSTTSRKKKNKTGETHIFGCWSNVIK